MEGELQLRLSDGIYGKSQICYQISTLCVPIITPCHYGTWHNQGPSGHLLPLTLQVQAPPLTPSWPGLALHMGHRCRPWSGCQDHITGTGGTSVEGETRPVLESSQSGDRGTNSKEGNRMTKTGGTRGERGEAGGGQRAPSGGKLGHPGGRRPFWSILSCQGPLGVMGGSHCSCPPVAGPAEPAELWVPGSKAALVPPRGRPAFQGEPRPTGEQSAALPCACGEPDQRRGLEARGTKPPSGHKLERERKAPEQRAPGPRLSVPSRRRESMEPRAGRQASMVEVRLRSQWEPMA